MNDRLDVEDVLKCIQTTIKKWHDENESRPIDATIVTEEVRRIRKLGDHRDDLYQVVEELTVANTEMWHEQDKMRSDDDKKVLIGTRNMMPLNQHRNDLAEEIDEIVADQFSDVKSFSDRIVSTIQDTIKEWHVTQKNTGLPYTPVTDEIRKRRVLGEHREDPMEVAKEIAWINTEIWHVEDIIRSDDDQAVVEAVRDENPMNVHRSELVEEIDEAVRDLAGKE